MNVGVRELKAHISEYVKRAAAGETIVVTDRGKPAAVLAPLPGAGRLAAGIEQGWITPASAAGLGPVRRRRASRRLRDALAEDRGD